MKSAAKKALVIILVATMVSSVTACKDSSKDSITVAEKFIHEADTLPAVTETTVAEPTASVKAAPTPIQVATYSVYKSSWDPETYESKAQIYYSYIKLPDETARAFPELAKFLEEQAEAVEAKAEAAFEKDTQTYDSMNEKHVIQETSVNHAMRADTTAISFLNIYTFNDSVETNTLYSGLNYSTAGKELKFTEVVADVDAFLAEVKSLVEHNSQYSAEELGDIDAYFKDFDVADKDKYSWFMTPEAIYMIINPGSLVPESKPLIIPVYFADHSELFTDDYKVIPETFVIPLLNSTETYVPVAVPDGKGGRSDIEIFGSAEDEYSFTIWEIGFNNEKLKIEDEAYNFHAYLICNNGHYYIYFVESGDNGYPMFRCITLPELKSVKADPEDFFIYTSGNDDWESDDNGTSTSWSEKICFTNPCAFRIAKGMNFLGTYDAYKDCIPNELGFPESEDDMYTVIYSPIIKVVKDVVVDKVDEFGKVDSETVLKAGTYFYIVRSDNNAYADVRVIPGNQVVEERDEYWVHFSSDLDREADKSQMYRITRDTPVAWPITYGGYEEEMLFEGMLYAG